MKPRNKTERRVVELSATLPPLRQKDAEWMDMDYKKTFDGKGLCYYLVMERCQEFQVIRYYYKTSKSLFEFAQIFINKDTKAVLAKDRWMGVDKWKRWSDMTIKNWFHKSYDYSYLGGMDRIGWSGVIVRSILPELKKRGMCRSTHGVNPYKFVHYLLNNNRIETLLKLKQYLLVGYFCSNSYRFDDDMWQSVRVALRHGYHWDDKKELSDWVDMIMDLRRLGLDTRNPHYICPANLDEAHEHYRMVIQRKRDKEYEQQRIEREAKEMINVLEYEPIFKKNRQMFFGMCFTDGEISISIIPTAQGIKEEGKAMHHCVGGYYNKPNSLILSAKIDGKRIETIEVNLSSYEIIQSRGVCNKDTEYHNRIMKLMKDNMNEIKKRNRKAA